ncbi:HAD family hydrolase [uncultured Sulfitobacter sp.]|uniref:HAD family hydrolase n=1 Tax=uncultured Sulfitobacter sp. TaxID=191468 RepID=UPI00260F5BC3|nr:HAD family hydrolase [uncultured Sulfitobacter sp.]
MSAFRGIVFDKDGTLFDFASTWEVWAQGFLARLCDGDRAAAAALGASIGFDYNARRFAPDSVVIAATPGDIVSAMLPQMPGWAPEALLDVINDEAAKAVQAPAVPLVPFLQGLRGAGYHLGVATNDAEMPARAHLDQAGVTGLFDFIAGFDSGHGGKPAPGQLLAFTAHTGLAPEVCVMVGDSAHDLHAGRAAGMACVGVLTGIAGHDDLAPHADVVMPDIGGLPDWLAGQGA